MNLLRDHPIYRRYLLARTGMTLGVLILSVAVAWRVYEITGNPFDLGLTGLAQFLPMIGLTLIAGQIADTRNPKTILVIAAVTDGICALALGGLSWSASSVWPIYATLVAIGAIRSFIGPASSALLPQIVAREQLPQAIAINTTSWQLATIIGPSLGGALCGILNSATPVFLVAAAIVFISAAVMSTLPSIHRSVERKAATLKTVFEGIDYLRKDSVLLGAISLDLFAVLLGGAVALLPIFATDILEKGAWEYGLLRSAPGIGAALTAIIVAKFSIGKYAGLKLYLAVAIFGVCTIGFGLSRSYPLSVLLLILLGATDMISVLIRQTLLQLHVPLEKRGRVAAVSQVFVGASNELGEFESGVTAAWLGPQYAVVAGGIGTLLIVGLWIVAFPKLFRIHRIDDMTS